MKIKKVIIGIGLLVLLAAGFYLYKLHSLALEGNKLFAFRCTTVNPPLIAYKNSFLKFSDVINNASYKKYTDEEVKSFYEGYISGMKEYVPEETKWLDMEKSYMNRWDFKLIEPDYIKQAAEYQWKMYEGYRDDAKYMLELVDNGGAAEEITAKFNDARDRRDKYEQLYYDYSDKATAINDWRKFFGRLPVPEGCNEDNMRIPNTSGAINWSGEPTPTPFVPSDTDATS